MFHLPHSRRLRLILGVVLSLLILAILSYTSREEAQFRVIEFVVQRGVERSLEAPKDRHVRSVSIGARDEKGKRVAASPQLVSRLRQRFPKLDWRAGDDKKSHVESGFSWVEVPSQISSFPFMRRVRMNYYIGERGTCGSSSTFLVSGISIGRFSFGQLLFGNGVITPYFFDAATC